MTGVQYLDQPFDVKDAPLWWHKAGLSQTATGYGGKLITTRKIRIKGEKVWRRVYVMCYSNAGTAYVVVNGENKVIRDGDL